MTFGKRLRLVIYPGKEDEVPKSEACHCCFYKKKKLSSTGQNNTELYIQTWGSKPQQLIYYLLSWLSLRTVVLEDCRVQQLNVQPKSASASPDRPDIIMSDNKLPFHEHMLKAVAMNYGTACPCYPQCNWLMENKIIKCLLKRWGGLDSYPYLTLLNYQMASVEYGLSSTDILFNRKLKTGLSRLLGADVRVSGYLQICKATDKTKQKYSVWFKVPEAASASWKCSCAHLQWEGMAANSTGAKTQRLFNCVCHAQVRAVGNQMTPNPCRRWIQGNELVPPRKYLQGIPMNKLWERTEPSG